MQFTVPVQADVYDLEFSWQSLTTHPVRLYPAPNQSPAPAKAPSQGPALLGAAACALGLVMIVGLIASAMYVRARKQIRQDSL
uniref:WIF domain-containing protein n=1 Tax=Megaselia scalaris TaxID=36166 RepID=T1GH12_MEGSC